MACAGALAVLERIDDDFLKEVEKKGAYMKEKILGFPGVKGVTGMGLMMGISIEGDAAETVKKALKNGLMSLTAKDKIRLLPPLTIEYGDIDKGLAILEDALK